MHVKWEGWGGTRTKFQTRTSVHLAVFGPAFATHSFRYYGTVSTHLLHCACTRNITRAMSLCAVLNKERSHIHAKRLLASARLLRGGGGGLSWNLISGTFMKICQIQESGWNRTRILGTWREDLSTVLSRLIRRTVIFSLGVLEKNIECILILVIYWKKTGL